MTFYKITIVYSSYELLITRSNQIARLRKFANYCYLFEFSYPKKKKNINKTIVIYKLYVNLSYCVKLKIINENKVL